MMGAPGGWGRGAVRFLWRSRWPLARLARVILLPLSALYAIVIAVRNVLYRAGALAVRRLPLPAVAVGNRAVGGAGKTPVAAWIAGFYAGRGRTPAVLLRGYGGDEPKVHERLVPGAVVVADPDRVAGAARALAAGPAGRWRSRISPRPASKGWCRGAACRSRRWRDTGWWR